MKRKLWFGSFIVLLLTMCNLTLITSAKVGDVVNHALYTDIVAYINHYPIQSYNIDGNTAIIAEDLANYGFNVAWNGEDKSLNITRNNNATKITPYGTLYKTDNTLIGKRAKDVLFTDIKTYVNGNEVSSYNVGGKTIIYFEDLKPYGEVVWVPEIRAIKMWIQGLPTEKYKPLEEAPTGMRLVVGPPNVYNGTGNYASLYKYSKFGFYVNSVDGVEARWMAQNLSGKTIKYYHVTVYMYNPVGDPAYCTIKGTNYKTINYVGPCEPNDPIIIRDVIGYTSLCDKIVIGEIELEYMDGTKDSGWYGYYSTVELYDR